MDVIAGFALLAALVALAAGLIMVMIRARRKQGLRVMLVAGLAVIGATYFSTIAANQAAQEAGFASSSEMYAARQAERDRAAEAERLAEEAQEAEELAAAEAEEREERRRGFHCLSAWDGAHRAFRDDVRDMMREPDSFEHIETRVTPVDAAGNHRIRMEYRARNGFGGMNVGVATGFYANDTCAHTVLSAE